MLYNVALVYTVKSESVSHLVMSDSLQYHGLYLCSWDSPGKNTGVDCHFLLQRIFPEPGIEPRSPALQTDAFPAEPPGKPLQHEGE